MTQPSNLWCRLLVVSACVATMGFTTPTGGIGGTGRPRGGIGGTGVTAIGVIQKFGSIFVNGTEYLLLPTTRYRIDGHLASIRALRRGDAVFVDAKTEGAHSVARSVRVQHAMIGIISAVHHHGQKLQVLGQTVLLDRSTLRRWDRDHPHKTLKAGMEVAVSALSSAPGVWHATRLHVVARPSLRTRPFLIRGPLHKIERQALTIGNRTFAWAAAHKPSAPIGRYVVARGFYRSGHPVLTSVRPATGLQDARGREVLVAGYVRGVGSRWHYQGLALKASAAPRNTATAHPAFFMAERDARGHFVIRRIVQNVHVMRYGLTVSRPNLNRRPDRPRVGRAPIARPHLNRPEIQRPEVMPTMSEPPEFSPPHMP
ncbi:MAG: DUF5666 domain-containing protein [Acidiferrobacter sp.]